MRDTGKKAQKSIHLCGLSAPFMRHVSHAMGVKKEPYWERLFISFLSETKSTSGSMQQPITATYSASPDMNHAAIRSARFVFPSCQQRLLI